jgi:multidrug resistance efflux pump
MSGTSGFGEYARKCWIPGEGWVRWTELQKQIDRAFQDWRMRRALAGHKTFDRCEEAHAHMREAQARKACA